MVEDGNGSGYVIAIDETTDADRFRDDYVPALAESIGAYDGEVLVRTSDPDVLGGESTRSNVLVLKFPSVDAAREWYDETGRDAERVRRDARERGNWFLVPETNDGVAPSRWRSFHPAWTSQDDG